MEMPGIEPWAFQMQSERSTYFRVENQNLVVSFQALIRVAIVVLIFSVIKNES